MVYEKDKRLISLRCDILSLQVLCLLVSCFSCWRVDAQYSIDVGLMNLILPHILRGECLVKMSRTFDPVNTLFERLTPDAVHPVNTPPEDYSIDVLPSNLEI